MPLVTRGRKTTRRLTRAQIEKVGIVRAAYIRIMFASDAGKGVTLSADEVEAICLEDDAVVMCAENAAQILGINIGAVL